MDEQKLQEKTSELEALLFVHGEPVTLKKAQSVLGVGAGDLDKLVSRLKNRLESAESGLVLISDGEKIQLATKPEFGKILQEFVKEELSEDLTPASLEALAIIAYFAPISRSRIEYLRGVNSIFILRSLLLRGLIERFPDPERPNAYLYRPTFDLLKHLGLRNREELSDFEKFQSLLKAFESQQEREMAPLESAPVESEEKKENEK
jgi:segregation and condensation protein B